MQTISIGAFTFHKETFILSEEASSLTGRLNMSGLLNYETFKVRGKRETKRYCLIREVREPANNEVGDILYWVFIPVGGHGRRAEGPEIHIYND